MRYPNPESEVVSKASQVRKYDCLFIVVVSKGENREALYRSWQTLKQLHNAKRGIYVYVVSDEPHYFDDLTPANIVVPLSYECQYARAKARALEYFRTQMRLTADDWVLHLDEESVIEQESLEACIRFIQYTRYNLGQGIILYNYHEYWKRLLLTVAGNLNTYKKFGLKNRC